MTKVGIPVAYGRFADDESVDLPFIVYNVDKKIIDSEGDIYLYEYLVNIEFYYQHKDIELEELFREAIYSIKKVADFEETVLSDYIVTRVTFNLLQSEEINYDNTK